MWKKLSLILMACTIVFSFSAGGVADAKSSYKSSKKSYSPSTTQNSGFNKSEPSESKSPVTSTNPAATQKRGFFSGGSLMKGLMIGGLAGMLFGGLFGGMGFMGHLLGMLVNVFALVILFVVIRKLFVYFRDRKKFKPDSNPRSY